MKVFFKTISLLICSVLIGACANESIDDSDVDSPTVVYSISYDGNSATSGTAPVDNKEYSKGDKAIILRNTGNLIKTGKVFTGWNSLSDGSGTMYKPDDIIEIKGPIRLYANWALGYTVTYDGNDATSGSPPSDTTKYSYEQATQVQDNTGNLEKDGFTFNGWTTQKDSDASIISPGNSFTIRSDITFYANWNGSARSFKAIKPSDNSWYTVNATLRASGTYSLVYVENGQKVTTAQAKAIAKEYDIAIYDKICKNFGAPLDVDGNGKMILLLLDIQDGYTGSGGFVAGYFHNTHMLDTTSDPNSNEADMLFLDTNPQIITSSSFYSTIAHELQHLVNYSNTVAVTGTSQDLWINEGLSSGAEYVYEGAVNQNRVSWFNADRLETIIEGNNFFVWDGFWENTIPDSVLDNYATVYLFFQWLRIHASNGTGIYKDILASTNRDYHAVTGAASMRIHSAFANWETLLGTWLGANMLCRTSGYYGYKNALMVEPACYDSSNNAKAELFPGEAVYSLLPGVTSLSTTGSYTPPAHSGANMRYRGLNLLSGAFDTSEPYGGHMSVVFNANTDNTANYEEGYVASVTQPSFALFNRSVADVSMPLSWSIDVQFDNDGNVSDITKKSLKKQYVRPLTKEEWVRENK